MFCKNRQTHRSHPLSAVVLLSLSLLMVARPTTAHETDQYTLPPGREFADLSDYLTRYMYRAIAAGVERQNNRIKAAVEGKEGDQVINYLRSPDQVADSVNRQFPVALNVIEGLDKYGDTPRAKLAHPGKLVDYEYNQKDGLRKYIDFPMSPFNAWSSGTIRAFGVYFGADKVGHFTDMGMHYYTEFRGALRDGKNEQQATKAMLRLGTDDPIYSETGLLGWATCGDYSNADLVANYMGFCFYRNLTESVMLKGQQRPPMLVQEGGCWKIADHVRPDSDFFSWFVSDHLNEALNPGLYNDDTRDKIRRSIKEHRKNVLVRYADPNGNPWSQTRFDAKVSELATYWGFDYGHRGQRLLMTVAHTCFAKPPDMNSPTARNADGLTSLHYAAQQNDVQSLDRLLKMGGDVNIRATCEINAPVIDGDTPLHVAARDGQVEAAQYLLAHGAKVNAINTRGDTPLHMAVEYPQVAQLLIAAGANVNTPDTVGRTPLHWAARDPSATASLQLLLSKGATASAQDRDGRTPLHDAASAAHVGAIESLVHARADVNATDHFGMTPLHLAAADAGAQVTDLLIKSGGSVNKPDDFGCTPLHVAARNGQVQSVAALVKAGANVNATDSYGQTALAAAQRQRYESVAQVLQGHPLTAAAEAQTAAATVR